MLSNNKLETELEKTKPLHIISVFMLILLGVSISIDTFNDPANPADRICMKIQLWVCLYFLFTLFVEFLFSKKKLRFLWRNILFILISIPYLNIFQLFDIHLSSEVSYIFHFVPLIRGGYALGYVIITLSTRKVSGLFFSYILILAALLYFYSLIFYTFEHKVNPDLKTYADALWWVSMQATTVGSEIIAVTPVGRVLSVMASIAGITMFPFFTVYVTSLVKKINIMKEHKINKKQ